METFFKRKKKGETWAAAAAALSNYVDILSKYYEQVSLQTQTVRK